MNFRSFNGFRNIPDSGSIFTVSEISLRFPKFVFGFRNMFTVSDIYVTYPGVGSLRGDPRRLRGDPQPPAASCHALVTAGSLVSKTRGGYSGQGVSRGGYPKKGGQPPLVFLD